MSFIESSEFTHDIFISYASVDNMPLPGDSKGWVDFFFESLKIKIEKRIGRHNKIAIWFDKNKLAGNEYFDEKIKNEINKSAIFLALTSEGFLHPESYCLKELDWFQSCSTENLLGIEKSQKSRIFNVLLRNIPPDKWPIPFQGMAGFYMYDSKNSEEIGEPLKPCTDYFYQKLDKIVNQIFDTLKEINYLIKNDISHDSKATDSKDKFIKIDIDMPSEEKIITQLPNDVYNFEKNFSREKIAEKIGRHIEGQDCIVWIGSGLSKIAGYPEWEEIIHKLCQYCGVEIPLKKESYSSNELIEIAQKCKQSKENEYYKTLNDTFNRPVTSTRRAYSQLMKLPFKGYITTNFDHLLMQAGKDEFGGDSKIYYYPKLPPPKIEKDKHPIFYLHGLAGQDENGNHNALILATSDFNAAYNDGMAKIFIQSITTVRTLKKTDTLNYIEN